MLRFSGIKRKIEINVKKKDKIYNEAFKNFHKQRAVGICRRTADVV